MVFSPYWQEYTDASPSVLKSQSIWDWYVESPRVGLSLKVESGNNSSKDEIDTNAIN